MTTDELSALLSNLHDELSREYELSLTDLTAKIEKSESEEILLELLDKTFPEQTRYNAFYCLNILYRRQKDFFKLKELFEKYSFEFVLHDTIGHLEALYDLESDSFYDYDKMLRTTYRDARKASKNAGFVHLFADAFATIYEKEGLRDKTAFLESWYDRALTEVDNAIKLDPTYAKYYCTKARILRIKGEFAQANYHIDKAISLENSARPDYALRIGNYQYYKLIIYTEMRLKELEKTMREEYGNAVPKSSSSANESANTPVVNVLEDLKAYLGSEPFVFISYSRKDADRIYPILKMLQDRRIRLWFDVNSILIGRDYYEYIGEKITECTVFMPFITANSLNSEFVRDEIALAHSKNRLMCSIFLEDLILSPGMEITIGRKQRVHWYTGNTEMNQEQLIRSLPPMVFHNAQN